MLRTLVFQDRRYRSLSIKTGNVEGRFPFLWNLDTNSNDFPHWTAAEPQEHMIIGIVAVDRQGAIGKGGNLPWHYSADMKFFRETTTGHACVMGYKTWLTLKRPLKDRLNIVLSRKSEVEQQNSVVVLRNPQAILSLTQYLRCDLFVMGGEQVYRAFLSHIDRWIVTEVPLSVEGADAFVPENYLKGFSKVDSRELDEGLTVRVFERVRD